MQTPAMVDTNQERLDAIARSLGIGSLDRHIFLCAEQSTPRCCTAEESRAVWRHLKRRLKDLDLASAPAPWRGTDLGEPPPDGDGVGGAVLRSKVDCFRVCEQRADRRRLSGRRLVPLRDRRRDEPDHRRASVGGVPVEEYVFAVDRLSSDMARSSSPEDSVPTLAQWRLSPPASQCPSDHRPGHLGGSSARSPGRLRRSSLGAQPVAGEVVGGVERLVGGPEDVDRDGDRSQVPHRAPSRDCR